MPQYTYIVPPDMDGKPLRFAAMKGLGLSSGQYKQFKFHGSITADGKPFSTDYRVFGGQELRFVLEEEARRELPMASREKADVVWEDENLLIINKPAPLPTAPGKDKEGETLENRVFSYLGEPENFVYRPVNRLDKGTSGLLVVAKDTRTQNRLQQLLHTEDFQREYLAVCESLPTPPEGVVDAPIAKVDEASVRRIVSPEGKPARTEYRVVRTGGGRSLLRLRLQTGRTHQIRVHMAWKGCPVCGDFLYGRELEELPGRFALHSCGIRLRHPFTGRLISAESPLPPELEALLEEEP